jgi:hypothetical protein
VREPKLSAFIRAVDKYDDLPGEIDMLDLKCPNRKAWKWVETCAVVAAFEAVHYMSEAGLIDDKGKLTEKGRALLPSSMSQ